MNRPDDRPSEVVWYWFNKAFEDQDFPNVNWVLGSDWGWGSVSSSAAKYKEQAATLMIALYGPEPEETKAS